ncbi:MAG: GNAT family N-acetyltransferase [Chloroflexi bacterium]|nr:GNAT family N-acetyltransferase [Chloroflexota bacterium]
MDNQLFNGTLVRLAIENPETDAASLARWERDTEFERVLSHKPVFPSGQKKWRERLEEAPDERQFWFSVFALAEDKLIGFVGIFMVRQQHGDCMVGIGMGEPEFRGKGYGTDALRLALRFAFRELNMHRVALMVLATNARAIRSYEKCGFVREGVTRGADYRDRIRRDVISMGILRSEWERANSR